jgi:hypothetical protein
LICNSLLNHIFIVIDLDAQVELLQKQEEEEKKRRKERKKAKKKGESSKNAVKEEDNPDEEVDSEMTAIMGYHLSSF